MQNSPQAHVTNPCDILHGDSPMSVISIYKIFHWYIHVASFYTAPPIQGLLVSLLSQNTAFLAIFDTQNLDNWERQPNSEK